MDVLLNPDTLLKIGGGVTAFGATVQWVIRPGVNAIRNRVHWVDAKKTLEEIAEQFKPNAGTSLHDRVQHIERTQEETGKRVEDLHDKFDVFIQQRLPGGNRSSDN